MRSSFITILKHHKPHHFFMNAVIFNGYVSFSPFFYFIKAPYNTFNVATFSTLIKMSVRFPNLSIKHFPQNSIERHHGKELRIDLVHDVSLFNMVLLAIIVVCLFGQKKDGTCTISSMYSCFRNEINTTHRLFYSALCTVHTVSNLRLKSFISGNTDSFESKHLEGCGLFHQTQTLDINTENMRGK